MTDRVTYQTVTVSAVDTVSATFTAQLDDGQLLPGIDASAQFLPAVGLRVKLWMNGPQVLYQPAGLASASVGDVQVSTIGLSKLSGGTWNVDGILAGSILNASTGQRAGVTPVGLQAWNASNALTVSIDGNTNLITGTWLSGLPGTRHIEAGVVGSTGAISLVAPDGTVTQIASYSESGVESIRLGNPIDDSWAGWNAHTVQGNEIIRTASGQIVQYFGGDTTSGPKQWLVYHASNSGAPGSQPSSTERGKIDASRVVFRAPDFDTQHEITDATHRFWVGTTSADGSVDIIPHGVPDANTRSPRIQLRGEGGTQAGNLKFVIAGGVNRIECTNTSDAYGEFRCLNVVQTSTARFKKDITDAPPALDIVRRAKGRQFTHVSPAGKFKADDGRWVDIPEQDGPHRIGLVAEEAPAELLSGDGLGLDIGTTAVVALLGVNELEARVAALEAKGRP